MKKNAMQRLAVFLLATASCMFSSNLIAEETKLTSDQKVAIGVMHSAKGEKKQAWEILFPEAKAGNVNALVHLGQLMVRSPEFPDYLERAEKYFSIAANRGHKGAAAMLEKVRQQLQLKDSAPTRTIGGRSALPTPADIEKARAFRAEYQRSTGRYINQPPSEPGATVHVFVTNQIEFADSIADQESSLTGRYGNRLKFRYYVVVDRRTWRPGDSFKEAAPRNMIGFEPDMDGQIARAFGLRQMPSIVLELANGSKKQISAQDLNAELAGSIK
jgi:hypothetical protein